MYRKNGSVARAAAIGALLLCASGLGAGAHASGSVFGPLLPKLHSTGVPVLLPGGLPSHIYAGIAMAVPGYYEVVMDMAPNCGGADACTYGDVIGQRGAHPPRGVDVPLTLTGTPIRLAQGHTGYFVPFGCGASCGVSTLTWSEHGYRYQIALHAGARKDAVRLANSAIQAGPR